MVVAVGSDEAGGSGDRVTVVVMSVMKVVTSYV